jgi:hypothetical protein
MCRVGPTRAGSVQSRVPKPLSIRTSPLSVSTSNTWQTIGAVGMCMVPQLRW